MRKYLIIILVLIGLSSQAQPYLVQSAKWQFKYGQRFDSAFRVYNLSTSTRTNGDTIITWNPLTKKIEKKIKLTLGNPADAVTNPEMFRVNGGAYFDGEHGVTVNSPLQVNFGTTINNLLTVNDGDGILVNNGGDVRATGVLSTAHTSGIGQVEFGQNASVLAPKNTTNRTWYLPDSSGTLALTSMISTNYWSTSGNTFSNGNYLGTSNNRGLPIVINGKKQVYFDTLAGVNLYDRNASRILSIYKNNSAASRTGTVYNSRPDSTNSSKSGHIFIADGANTSPAAGTYYSTVAIQQGSLSTSGTGIASSLLVQPQTIIQSGGSGYISGITINSGNTIGGGALYFRGLDIPNCGNNSNAYGIHQADAVGRNYFAASTQFGSTTTSTSAQVQINSTTKGFLPPVMTNAQKNAISSPATGLVVYDNGTNKLNYYNGSSWRGLDSSSGGSSYTAGRAINIYGSVIGLDTTLSLTWTNAKTIFNSVPTATANYGVFNIGSGAFDGSAAGFFTGSSSGTTLAINNASGYVGDLINAQVAGVSKFKITSNGTFTCGNASSTTISNDGFATFQYVDAVNYVSTPLVKSRNSSGIILLSNITENDFSMLKFGGTTSSFPALKKSSTTIQVRLADDSGDANLSAKSVRGVAVTFANVPTPVEGMILGITDSTTDTWGATITGGGSLHVLAYYNGTNWTVFGK